MTTKAERRRKCPCLCHDTGDNQPQITELHLPGGKCVCKMAPDHRGDVSNLDQHAALIRELEAQQPRGEIA